jgi:hypothetical protein
MRATIHKERGFSEIFMAYLLSRNGRIEEDLIDQLFNSSEKRLARLLLLLANFGKEDRPEPIGGKFSQEMLVEAYRQAVGIPLKDNHVIKRLIAVRTKARSGSSSQMAFHGACLR